VVLDGDIAFFDVDIGRTVLAHGAELDEMTVRGEFANRKEHVQCADNVIHLSEDRVLTVDHRIRSRTLLGEVDDSFRLETLDHRSEKIVIGDITDEKLDGLARDLLPDPETIREKANRR